MIRTLTSQSELFPKKAKARFAAVAFKRTAKWIPGTKWLIAGSCALGIYGTEARCNLPDKRHLK